MFAFLPPKEAERLFAKTITKKLNLREIASEFATSVIQFLKPSVDILSNQLQKRRWIQSMDSAHGYVSEKLPSINASKELTAEWETVS